jgi:hypothetical protein
MKNSQTKRERINMMVEEKEFHKKGMVELSHEETKSEDDIIREIAEEEGMSYEEVKEIWETFKFEARTAKASRATKPKRDKEKVKAKKKQAKKSKKRNR